MRLTVWSSSSRPSNMSLRASAFDLRRGPRSSLTSLRAANARLLLLSFLALGFVGLDSLFKDEERGGMMVDIEGPGEGFGRVLLEVLTGKLSAEALCKAPLLLEERGLESGCRFMEMLGLGVAMSSSTSSKYNLPLELFLAGSLASRPRFGLNRA